jgi:hypothetical protein
MAKAKPPGPRKPPPQARARGKPALLAGGNPQIAKADGDAPVQAYIAAMPGWKRGLGRRARRVAVRGLGEAGESVAWMGREVT